jgi:xanthine/uracil permease
MNLRPPGRITQWSRNARLSISVSLLVTGVGTLVWLAPGLATPISTGAAVAAVATPAVARRYSRGDRRGQKR